jgi:hypothetical protein
MLRVCVQMDMQAELAKHLPACAKGMFKGHSKLIFLDSPTHDLLLPSWGFHMMELREPHKFPDASQSARCRVAHPKPGDKCIIFNNLDNARALDVWCGDCVLQTVLSKKCVGLICVVRDMWTIT